MAQYTFPADINKFINREEIIEEAYPVGMVVVTAEDVNPADLGLPGTWEAV